MPFEPRFKTLVDIFRSSVEKFGPHPLLGTKRAGKWDWVTYARFGSDVDRLRGGLASLGLRRGDRVAIIANNRVEWAVAAYACFGLGAAFVPMYEAQNPSEWEFIVRDCGARAVVVAEAVLAKAERLSAAAASLEHFIVLGHAVPPKGAGTVRHTTYAALLESGTVAASIDPAPDDLAALLYTSGTTGIPKGVMLTHLNLASNVSAIREVYQFGVEDRSLAFLPWAHAFGQTAELHDLIASGASIAICEGNDKILDNLVEIRPTVLFSVPRLFNRLYTALTLQIEGRPRVVREMVAAAFRIKARKRAGKAPKLYERALLRVVDRLVGSKVRARFGGRLKYAVSGGAALSREVAELLDSLGVIVYEGYGLTETSPVVSVNLPGAQKIGTVGPALPGVRATVSAEGELIVYGPNVMKGYLDRPQETAAMFTADGGLRTGDMASIDAEGFITITGRLKEQYKLENGKYVVPTPLEEQLKLSPFVLNAMVYGDGRPHNVALIVANLPAITQWAEENKVQLAATPAAALTDSRVRALYQTEIDKHNKSFKGFEAIRDFALIAEDFTTENGMLTPKMSVRRRKVVETYAGLFDQMYARSRPEPGARPAAVAV